MSTNTKKSGAALYVNALPKIAPRPPGKISVNQVMSTNTRKSGAVLYVNALPRIAPCPPGKRYAAKKLGLRKQKRPRKNKDQVPRIKRPINSFMIWGRKNRPLLAKEFPEMSNQDISIKLGEKWKSMNSTEKQPFVDEAFRVERQHREDHPDWEFKPRKKTRNLGDTEKSLYFEVRKNSNGEYVTSDVTDIFQRMVSAQSLPNEKPNNIPHVLYNPTNGKQPTVYLGSFMLPPNVLASGGVMMAEFSPIPTFEDQELVEITSDTDDRQCQKKSKKRKLRRSFENQPPDAMATNTPLPSQANNPPFVIHNESDMPLSNIPSQGLMCHFN